MIEDSVIIDAVVHGYNSPPESYLHPLAGVVVESLYSGYHLVFSPRGDQRWRLDRKRFERADADLLGHALFAESQTDYAIYHDIPLYGMYKGGASPLWVGCELRERHPDRVAVFGGRTIQTRSAKSIDWWTRKAASGSSSIRTTSTTASARAR